jgi:N-acetylglucosamine-6-sulfatase
LIGRPVPPAPEPGRRRLIAAAAALVVSAALGLVAGAGAPAGAAEARPARPVPPNVIVIVTDDQSNAMFERSYMPRTFRLLVDRGTWFEDAVVTTPLCCPSRAGMATGQYGHNNGVLRNLYSRLEGQRNVLANWLTRAGYRTMHVGRFFNGYEGQGREGRIAPGWDVWRTALSPRSYYDYAITTNTGVVRYGGEDEDFLTDRLDRIAANLIERRAPRKKPFYLQLDHFAPHDGPGDRSGRCERAPVPGPGDEAAYLNQPVLGGGSFNEADVSDKPPFMQALPPLDAEAIASSNRRFRCALASLRAVDRGVAEIWRAVKNAGAADETVVIFTSDNGYLHGEHRVRQHKQYPYEEAVGVPLVIRLPKPLAPDGQIGVSPAPVANIDIAPTILELSGAEPCIRSGCRTLDGRSLLGEALGDQTIPPGRAIVLEYDGGRPSESLVCRYAGIRTPTDVFVEHTLSRTAEGSTPCEEDLAYEHYDRAADPAQLDNLVPPPASGPLGAEQLPLLTRLRSLQDCSGILGRDPEPPTGHYCE